MRVAVLASGEGTTLQSLIDAVSAGRLDAGLSVVVSNNRQSGDAETGVSVHLVGAEYDTGPVIAQARLAVPVATTVEALEHDVRMLEREFLCATLQRIADGSLQLGAGVRWT